MSLIVKSDLMGFIQPLTGLLTTSVSWRNDPATFVSPTDNVSINLKLSGIKYWGVDDVVRTFTPGTPGTYSVTSYGVRCFNLEIVAEAYNYQAEAIEVLENLRMRLGAQFNIEALNLLGMTIHKIGPTIDLPTQYDNRVVSAAYMLCDMGATNSLSWGENSGTWIDTVNTNDKIPGTIT